MPHLLTPAAVCPASTGQVPEINYIIPENLHRRFVKLKRSIISEISLQTNRKFKQERKDNYVPFHS
jgi:hypothetical protein